MEFGNSLKFDKHICSVTGSRFFHLRLLAKIKPFLSEKTLEVAMLLLRLGLTATLCIMVFQSLKLPVYKWFRMQQHKF